MLEDGKILFLANSVYTYMNQWLFYTPLVWGETASFGGDIGV